MTKGTASMGKISRKVLHIRCRRCGRSSYHVTKKRCSSCGYGASSRLRGYKWQKRKK